MRVRQITTDTTMTHKTPVRDTYNHAAIEKKWQKYWSEHATFAAQTNSEKEKKYILAEFPYPSGEGLHMGHLRPYTAGDVYSRFCRMKGYETLFPMGWDAFGLPAENFAIKKGVHPRISTADNIKNAKKQLQSWGMSFDWSREINTTDPSYYKWTQWIFLQFFNAGLAYEATGMINWCPKDKTGLANEEVIDESCERCGAKIEKKELRQWYLKITAYAEKLLAGLTELTEWPEPVRIQQENWIGKSEGACIDFRIKNSSLKIPVFTTRPDTLYGATYVVLAPDHELLKKLNTPIGNIREVKEYCERARTISDIERTSLVREKTGVPLKGITAIHPATKEEIPVWLSDYVLASYGTGAVMGVPAHDDRDLAFAKKFRLPIKIVIMPENPLKVVNRINKAYTGPGTLVSSGQFSGMPSERAKKEIVTFVKGSLTINFKIRDWVFSPQRYWGEPIPLIHCVKCGVVGVPEEDLPVRLPDVKKYEPTGTGESPLAGIEKWIAVPCPKCKGPGKRETNTMPQWAGSSWYYARYIDPSNTKSFADKKSLERWLPVDVYFGGMEHTTLHLLYSRFWNLFLYDQKHVPVKEPYFKRVPHGIILGPDGEKMSKSRGNVVNPNDIVALFGADTLRMYELFIGPHEAMVSWDDKGIIGIRRFIERVWRLYVEYLIPEKNIIHPPSEELVRAVHKTIKKVTEDIPSFRFNTAVSALMVGLNSLTEHVVNNNEAAPKHLQDAFILLLAPFAPHISEELWARMGHAETLTYEPWPAYDTAQLVTDTITITVQVNGKSRDFLAVPSSIQEDELNTLALEQPQIKKWIDGKEIKKTIYVPGRLINFVV